MKLVFIEKAYLKESEDGRLVELEVENNKVSQEVKVVIRSWDNSKKHKFLRGLDGSKVKITIEELKQKA